MLALSVVLSFAPILGVFAEDTNTSSGQNSTSATYNKVMANSKPTSFDNTDDPYGYGEDVPFNLNTKEELMLYSTTGSTNSITSSITSYDNLNLSDVVFDETSTTTDYASNYPLTQESTAENDTYTIDNMLSHVQMISFDPTGSGRNDHIAIIGTQKHAYNNSGSAVAHIYMTIIRNDGKTSNMLLLGPSAWMSNKYPITNWLNNDNMYDFNSMNFFGLTAGDYDGDGKDTLVAYGAFSVGSATGCADAKLIDISLTTDDNGNITISTKKESKVLLHDKYLYLNGDNWVENRLHCALDSGDLNNDGIDDLAVLSYMGRPTIGNDYRKQATGMYIPQLCVSYGSDKGTDYSVIDGTITIDEETYTTSSRVYVNNKDGSANYTCIAPGIAIGDTTGNGTNEIVVAGPYNEVIGNSMTDKVSSCCNPDNENMRYWIYSGAESTISEMYNGTRAANAWTTGGSTAGGLYCADTSTCDQSWQRTGVETVAINGEQNPELIFVNGSLFSFDPTQSKDSDKFASVYTGKYFNSADEGAGGIELEETYIKSMAVGNFDNNEYGYEQIIYTLGAADSNAPGDAIFYMGTIGGIHNGNSIATKYYCTQESTFSYYPDSDGDSCMYGDRLNYTVCSWDNDYDGLRARYKGKNYVYSDPEVMAVLQAPAYYSEMDDYRSEPSLEYTVTQSIESETATSNSTSFGVGVTQGLSGTLGGYEVSAGYATDWTEEFSESWSESYSYNFETTAEDSVVLCRTPVYLYAYEVQTNGEWEGETIILSFPCEARKSVITLDDYNSFVDEYNSINKNISTKLEKIDDNYLGHAGDPLSYMTANDITTGVKVLQSSPIAVEVSNGTSSGFSYEYSESSGHSESMAHGFNFELEIEFGLDIPMFVDAKVGAKTSLQYMHENSYSVTNTTGTTVSCSLGSYDQSKLEKDGVSSATSNLYTFNYQLVRWNSGISGIGKDTDLDVYTYGFVLSDLKEPLPVVEDLSAEFVTDEDSRAIKLSWSEPDKTKYDYGAYTIYEYLKNGEKQIVDTIESNTTEYIYKGFTPSTEFYFTIAAKSSINSNVIGLESNTAFLETAIATAVSDIKLTSSENDVDTYTVMYTDGTESNFTVRHANTITSFNKTDVDGPVETYTITYSDGTTDTYTVDLSQLCSEGHNYEEFTVPATCTSNGFTFKFCKACGNRTLEVIEPTGHNYESVVTEPTCTHTGYTTYTCSVCNDQYVSDITDIIDHEFTDKVIKNTCVSDGFTIHYCEVCGYMEIADETQAKGHSFEVTETVEPTCSTKGYSIYTCKDCGVSYMDDETECKAHTFTDKVIAPNCKDTGYTIHTCDDCGFTYIDTETPVVAHVAGNWICEDPTTGLYVKRCENCYAVLETKTVTIDATITSESGIATNENGKVVIGYQETVQIPLNLDGVEGVTVEYTSSDTDVVTVDEQGNVTAVGPGEAIVTAKVDGTDVEIEIPVSVEMTWWQKVHYILNANIFFRILYLLFGVKVPYTI